MVIICLQSVTTLTIKTHMQIGKKNSGNTVRKYITNHGKHCITLRNWGNTTGNHIIGQRLITTHLSVTELLRHTGFSAMSKYWLS